MAVNEHEAARKIVAVVDRTSGRGARTAPADGVIGDRPRYVRVESQDNDIANEVDLDLRSCDCGGRHGRLCVHLQKAIDLCEEDCRTFHFEVASALHKEIRRGDVAAALHWADHHAASSDGARYVQSYARQICGEETRNAKYIWMCLEPVSRWTYRDYIHAIARSRKKWELRATADLFREQMLGWRRVQRERTIARWRHRSCLSTMRAAIDDRDAPRLHEGLWWLYCNVKDAEVWKGVDRMLAEAVSSSFPGIPRPHLMISAFEGATRRDPFELRFMFVEALSGGWDESMNEFRGAVRLPQVDRSLIRRFPDYVYDAHVRSRGADARRWRIALQPNEPSPGRLDLRWSGEMIGVAWRYAAYSQLGRQYVDAPWEAVNFQRASWKLAVEYGADDE